MKLSWGRNFENWMRTRKTRRSQKSLPPAIQNLEERTLLTVSTLFANNELTVVVDEGNDTVALGTSTANPDRSRDREQRSDEVPAEKVSIHRYPCRTGAALDPAYGSARSWLIPPRSNGTVRSGAERLLQLLRFQIVNGQRAIEAADDCLLTAGKK